MIQSEEVWSQKTLIQSMSNMGDKMGDWMDSSAQLGNMIPSFVDILGQVKSKKFPVLSEAEVRAIKSRLDQKWNKVYSLPICKRVPKVCTDRNIIRLRFALLAEATMYESVLGMGGAQLANWMIFFFVFGVLVNFVIACLNHRFHDEALSAQNPNDLLYLCLDVCRGHSEKGKADGEWLALSPKLSPWLPKSVSFAKVIFRKFFCLLSILVQPIEVWSRWWGIPPGLSQPLSSMKLFVCMLLFMELSVWMSPEQCVLATPELVSLARRYPWTTPGEENHHLVPPMAFWLMPDLESNVEAWVAYLTALRRRLLLSWCIFMVAPNTPGLLWQTVNTVSYAYGALAYAYFGTIGLMYNLAHSVQGGMLFVVSAIFAVPFLETNPKAGAWLRKFLLLNVLVPVYLFAGVNKLRYLGLGSNISGAWLVPILKDTHRAVFPELNMWMATAPAKLSSAPWPCMLMSWGNLAVEFVLPVIAIVSLNQGPLSSLVRLLFIVGAMSFHVAVFFTMGPNFMRQMVLLVLASNPLRCFGESEKGDAREMLLVASIGDRLRGIYGILILALWYGTQLWSDFDHLMGRIPWERHHNPYFPFPELSMFALGGKNSNYEMSCMILIVIFGMQLVKMLADVELHQANPTKDV